MRDLINVPEEATGRIKRASKKVKPSIRWSEGEKAFKVQTDETRISTLFVDKMNYRKFMAGDYNALYEDFDHETMTMTDASHPDTLQADVEYILHINKFGTSVNELPYGAFTLTTNRYGEVLLKKFESKIGNSNNLVKAHDLTDEVIKFFSREKNPGRKNKKGILLYGPPGNGKTSNILELSKVAEELKLRIIFILNADLSLWYLQQLKSVLEGERMVFVLEEITERLKRQTLEEMLTFLDGESSWDNSITIATTNHPDQLPANIVDRPGRLDTFVKYENPTKEQVKEMLSLSGLSDVSENEFFKSGKPYSFDYVSFIIAKVIDEKSTVAEVIKSEEARRKMLSETFKGKIGIGWD